MARKKNRSPLRRRAARLRRRSAIQALATLAANPYLPNFLAGRLHNGLSKGFCLPGLNCYSCPAAGSACPIGALQAVIASPGIFFSCYVGGLLLLFGALGGRFVIGVLCPFGFLQDLLHRIPTKKLSGKKLRALGAVKYLVLALLVCLLPALLTGSTGLGTPFFCKYLCPQGALEGGIPLSLADGALRQALGGLFAWKVSLLLALLLLAVFLYRPFCKWLCPLGALYSLCNRFSILQYQVDAESCVSCGKCARQCKMDVDITQNAAHRACIRCGECRHACPTEAIHIRFGHLHPPELKSKTDRSQTS